MRFKLVGVALITCCCWSVFAEDHPVPPATTGDYESSLKQQISELNNRVSRLESQFAQMHQITGAIGVSSFDDLSAGSSADPPATVEVRGGGFDEGMMIDAIEHKLRWQQRSRLLR